jgi:hypothetical protein
MASGLILLSTLLTGCAGSPSSSEISLDKEDLFIGTYCSTYRNMLTLWEESASLARGGTVIQRQAADMVLGSLADLVEKAISIDARLENIEISNLDDDNRNSSGDISASDLYFFASKARVIAVQAEANDFLFPSVGEADLVVMRDLCREFPNAIELP